MPIEQPNISDQVYELIRGMIIDGEVGFGERLHIRNLAERLGVSPTPIREALNRLMTDGLAESSPRRGMFVVNPDERDIVELCEARACLEAHMAPAVIRRATDEQIEALYRYAARTASDTLHTDIRKVLGFHDYYASLSGNTVMRRLHRQVHGLLTVLFSQAIEAASAAYVATHHAEEEAICDAVRARDIEQLRAAIAAHIDGLRGVLLRAHRAANQPTV